MQRPEHLCLQLLVKGGNAYIYDQALSGMPTSSLLHVRADMVDVCGDGSRS